MKELFYTTLFFASFGWTMFVVTLIAYIKLYRAFGKYLDKSGEFIKDTKEYIEKLNNITK